MKVTKLTILNVVFFSGLFLIGSVEIVYSDCNQKRVTGKKDCLAADVKTCSRLTGVCAGSEAPVANSATVRVDRACSNGGEATDHCVIKGKKCGYWCTCEVYGTQCQNGDPIQEEIDNPSYQPGSSLPPKINIEKSYETQTAVSIKCPGDGA
jgi:hypothetical protein